MLLSGYGFGFSLFSSVLILVLCFFITFTSLPNFETVWLRPHDLLLCLTISFSVVLLALPSSMW